MDNEHELKDCNVQAEILFVGSIAKDLDLIVNYSTFMRSKYDFSDPATKFFYDNLETYFLTFSQTLDETKMNVFMSQNEERLKLYKQYKGCPYMECVRYYKNIPYNVLILRENYKLDKNNECPNILLDWGDDI